jgi:acetylornithine deacetylase/succinyl-diaminopimelate desuccinylase-like protein
VATVADALAHADASAPARLLDLARWLAIPSVSRDRAALERAAEFLEREMHRAGAVTARLATATAPVVTGWTAGPPGSPVVAAYGHYDVQPAGPGWTSPPFRPVLRHGALVARGANDDKGQLFAVIAALRAWRQAGRLPCSVLIIAEGAEETGSPGLRGALATIARRVHPDVVLACDTERAVDGVPAVTVSQRGQASLVLRVSTGGSPVHAGRLGGAVIDPALTLARIVIRLEAVAGRPAGDWPAGPGTDPPDEAVRRVAGPRAVRPGPLGPRITRCPALSVTRLRAGQGGAAIPASAEAWLDLRLPAGVSIRAAVDRLARTARQMAPAGVSVSVTARATTEGQAAVPRAGALTAIDRACRAVYGQPAALVRSGGSLPAARLLGQAFGQPPVLLGLGDPGGGAHGPDEHLNVAGWGQVVHMLVRLLADPVHHRVRGPTPKVGHRPRGWTCQRPCQGPPTVLRSDLRPR